MKMQKDIQNTFTAPNSHQLIGHLSMFTTEIVQICKARVELERKRRSDLCVGQDRLDPAFLAVHLSKRETLSLMAVIPCSKSCPWPTQGFTSCKAEQAGTGFGRVIIKGELTSEFLTMIGHGEHGTREGAGESKQSYSSS